MYTQAVIDRFNSPRHAAPTDPKGMYGAAGDPGGGPYVEIWIEMERALIDSEAERGHAVQDTSRATGRATGSSGWELPYNRPIRSAVFRTYGCPASVACADLACAIATGRTPEQVMLLEPADLVRILGGLPEGKEACAERAVTALHSALNKKAEV